MKLWYGFSKNKCKCSLCKNDIEKAENRFYIKHVIYGYRDNKCYSILKLCNDCINKDIYAFIWRKYIEEIDCINNWEGSKKHWTIANYTKEDLSRIINTLLEIKSYTLVIEVETK